MNQSIKLGWYAALACLLGVVPAAGCGGDPTTSAAQSTTTTTDTGGGGTTTSTTDGGGGTNTGATGGGGTNTGATGGTSTGGGTNTGASNTGASNTGASNTGGTGNAGGGTGGATGGTGGQGPCMDDAACDDGDFCNGSETCVAGTCTAGTNPCNDGVSCTVDGCDEALDTCSHVPSSALCDDGAFCNGTEACNPAAGDPVTGCLPGTSPCDDGLACTVDGCDEVSDLCSHSPDNALCDDGLTCTGTETCNAIMGCLSSGAPSCDDAIACTSDFCDVGSDSCAHVPNSNLCQDNVFCNGPEVCDPMMGCKAGAPVDCGDNIVCTNDVCSEASKSCLHFANNAACSDNVFCNGAEVCTPGFGCGPGTPPDCDDGRSCTVDACDNGLSACTHTPNNAACSDGLDCNGAETCSVNGPGPTGCVAGMPIPCPPDNISCTVDACDEATNMCAHVASNALCPNGQLCIPAAGGCTAAMPCNSDAQCNDGNACNGVETCNVVCQPGAPPNCADAFDCTVDSCNPQTGACVHTPNNAFCDNGFACDGVETCSAQSGCMAGPPKVCNDNIACTNDACVEPGGTCSFTPSNANCSDGQLCNGTEVCDPPNGNAVTGCKAGAPFVCPSDGKACTSDTCDPMTNSCVYVPNNALCPCGQTCDLDLGCGNFCQISTCQGKVYACGDCLDNDGDCAIDSADTQCLGPCDNTEDGFYGGIPGQNNSPCKSDCYFDQDTGSGNDDCYWSHKCDPLEVAPNYPPEGQQCEYNPNANIPGTPLSCSQAFQMQSATCLSYCGPLTPNGCDCFGCCAIPGAPTTVWLGSENPAGTGSCNLMTLNDPSKCKPCTQVQACLNTCDVCEICIGKPTLPPQCMQQDCPPGAPPCGLPGQEGCGLGFTCITGCCQANPN